MTQQIENNQLLQLLIAMNTEIGKMSGRLETYTALAARTDKEVEGVCERVSALENLKYKFYGVAVGIGVMGGFFGDKIAQLFRG